MIRDPIKKLIYALHEKTIEAEGLFEKIMADNVPNLRKDKDIQIK